MLKTILLGGAGIAAIAFGLLRYQQKQGRSFFDRSDAETEDNYDFYFDQPDCGLEIIRSRSSLEGARTVH